MMISPLSYIAEYENDTFEQLLQERDCLIAEIHELEKKLFIARIDQMRHGAFVRNLMFAIR